VEDIGSTVRSEGGSRKADVIAMVLLLNNDMDRTVCFDTNNFCPYIAVTGQ